MKRAFSRLSLAVAAVLLASNAAVAGFIGTATEVPGFNAPDAALTGFTAYQLSVSTDDGSVISAVDVSIAGQLHQRWSDVDFDFVPDPSPNGPPANGRGDSHLTLLQGALIGSAPAEDNSGVGSPLPSGAFTYGLGSYLKGAWGIPGSSQTSSADLAYIVIPTGSEPTLEITVDIAGSAGGGRLDAASFGFVPEPSSIALIGLAMVGVALRFKRR